MTKNEISYQQNLESKRHNLRVEEENERSNRAQEQLSASALAESIRHNQASEAETQRSNLARELETNRHNLATEYYTGQQINLGYAQLGETQRHNEETERNAGNQTRNQAAFWNQSMDETVRHNTAMENETSRNNTLNYATKREQVAAQYDVARMNNQAAMQRQAVQTIADLAKTLFNAGLGAAAGKTLGSLLIP